MHGLNFEQFWNDVVKRGKFNTGFHFFPGHDASKPRANFPQENHLSLIQRHSLAPVMQLYNSFPLYF
jgi:hypothetical protein